MNKSPKSPQKKGASYLQRAALPPYPCFLPDLGEFGGSWPYKAYPDAKVDISFFNCNSVRDFFIFIFDAH